MDEENSEKSALVPRLRFPEFHGVVSALPLAAVADLVSEKTSVDQLTLAQYVSTENLLADFGGMTPAVKLPSVSSVTSFRPNDVLVSNIRPYLRKVWQANIFGGASNDVLVVRPSERVGADYLAAILRSDLFIDYVMLGAKGVKMPRGEISMIQDFSVPCPNADEQQKIADCLSSLDELVTAETQKLDALKTHKKGLMQQLFPREGETVPRLRFPEFSEKEGWKKERLEDLAKRGSGHTPSKAHPEYYDGGIKWVSLADSKRLDAGLITETEVEISAEGIANSSAVLHPAGSVLLSRDAAVGRGALMGEVMAVSQHFIVWTCKPTRLSNWFLYYSLQQRKPVFERVATGSTIKTIGLPFFIDMRIEVPTLPEQEMIAACLRTLDDLITAQSQKIDALKTHKQGLMQQLFPVLDGVSA